MKFISIAAAALLLFSCAKNVEEDLTVDDPDAEPENVTYSGTISPLITSSCATTGCHSGSTPTAGLNLETYDKVMTLVTPNDLSKSYLYGVITHTQLPKMPKNASKLADSDIENVKTWILNGAKND